MEAIEVHVVREPPGSDLVSHLLARYFAELGSRFPGGFDASHAVAVSTTDLVASNGAFLVAYLDGGPVGCGAVRRLDTEMAEIKHMWIDPTARRRGVARLLLRALEDVAAEMDCRLVRLDTSAHLIEALCLYKSSGYGEIPAYNDNAYADHWFEKRLRFGVDPRCDVLQEP
ncbi:MAG: GNAT family N-acetyltransferase [Acidimicrobiales bacterium]